MLTPSLEQAKSYIYSLDLSPVIGKMVDHLGWNRREANETCQFYRNFLFLNKKYTQCGPLPPSEDIDEFWHNHILDTEKYAQDCQFIFGKYFHHDPYFMMGKKEAKNLQEPFGLLQRLHYEEFGDYIYQVRKNGIKRFFQRILDR